MAGVAVAARMSAGALGIAGGAALMVFRIGVLGAPELAGGGAVAAAGIGTAFTLQGRGHRGAQLRVVDTAIVAAGHGVAATAGPGAGALGTARWTALVVLGIGVLGAPGLPWQGRLAAAGVAADLPGRLDGFCWRRWFASRHGLSSGDGVVGAIIPNRCSVVKNRVADGG